MPMLSIFFCNMRKGSSVNEKKKEKEKEKERKHTSLERGSRGQTPSKFPLIIKSHGI